MRQEAVDKTKTLAVILAVIVIVSLSVNVYLASQNSTLTTQSSTDTAKIDMIATLAKVQTNTDVDLKRIGDSLIYASKQLSSTRITGS